MTYRIITDHGTVDFSADYEIAVRKFSNYVRNMHEGYSNYVCLVLVDGITGREKCLKKVEKEC